MGITSEMDIAGVVERALMQEIERLIAEETKVAQDRIEERIRRQLGVLTMSVFKEFEFDMGRQFLTIRIKNDIDG